MTIDRVAAAASLNDVAAIERRTREALAYARGSVITTLWGVLSVIGYVFAYFRPEMARPTWLALFAAGFAATVLIVRRRARVTTGSTIGEQMIRSQLALFSYGFVLLLMLWPLDARQVAAFWPTLIMLGIVLMGIWLGRFFIVLGLSVTALTVIGYFGSGDWFPLWMAAANGGGLIAAGWWLRRVSA
jgi:hypothetical protein